MSWDFLRVLWTTFFLRTTFSIFTLFHAKLRLLFFLCAAVVCQKKPYTRTCRNREWKKKTRMQYHFSRFQTVQQQKKTPTRGEKSKIKCPLRSVPFSWTMKSLLCCILSCMQHYIFFCVIQTRMTYKREKAFWFTSPSTLFIVL